MGSVPGIYGYNTYTPYGVLPDKDFDFGMNSHTIAAIGVDSQTGSDPGALRFLLDIRINPSDFDNLVLHVGGTEFNFSTAYLVSRKQFIWDDAGLDWSKKGYIILHGCGMPRPVLRHPAGWQSG